MLIAFHVGQHVICIDDRPKPGVRAGHGDEKLVKAGITYTVRELVPGAPFGLVEGVRLAEVVNPVRRYTAPTGPVWTELQFRADRFAPPPTPNIDVFAAMLEPVPQKSAELIDA